MVNEQDIEDWLRCPKVIVRKVPAVGFAEPRPDESHRRCDLDLESVDTLDVKFSVFIRQSTQFVENFSIGLRHRPDVDPAFATITLIRYNGPHGETARHPDGHYAVPHIHRITANDIAAGNLFPQERYREPTDTYEAFDSALLTFWEDLHVSNFGEYFPHLIRPRLIDE